MINFTYNNHLKYYIDNIEYGIRNTIYDRYAVSVGQVDINQYKKTSWLNEQYRTADLIYKEFGKDLVVMFSGGTDSEIVLRAFKEIGITPRAVFIRFENDYNLSDFKTAEIVARDVDVPLEVIDFDIVEFFNSGNAAEFSKEVQCSQIAYLNVYYHILKLQCPAVMGGEVLLKRSVSRNNSRWYYCFRENEDASAMRFSIKYNIPLVNEWFSYTPEMLAHFLENAKVKSLISDRFNYKLASVSSKNTILYELMPSLIKKVKTHGFEKLLGFNGETYQYLQKCFVKDFDNNLNGIYMEDIYKQLFGDNYGSN
jgi:hypothetical protein